MADKQRRLILGNGEQYVEAITKALTGRSPEPPRTYEEARQRISTGVSTSLQQFRAIPKQKKLPEEAVFCLRLHPDATPKTYSPTAIFDEVPELRNVGSRTYHAPITDVAQTKRLEKKRAKEVEEVSGRLVFVQSSPQGFERFLRHLDRAESQVPAVFREQLRRVERFDTLDTNEQILGFSNKWREGRVELVLHPSRTTAERQLEFLFQLFDDAGVNREKSAVRQYPSGPTFVSCHLTRKTLNSLAGTNPLRAAHPFQFGGLSQLRTAPTASAPKPPASTTRSTIKVGMFDGGVDPAIPLLQGHVEEDESLGTQNASDPEYVAHGTAVAGALLHAQLNGLTPTTRVPTPPVYVVSFRALPTSDPNDIDLFEAIDVIERVVPARNDIKVYNLSFGPRGPIQDDTLSRFTYALDTLAYTHKATFYVAVGNDGDVVGEDRIQAPSDLVHGVAVGAFTMAKDVPIHAPYSCKGPGRECGKIKPDVVAYGGCENVPIHLVSTTPNLKVLHWGTSFAAPLAARLGAQASEGFDRSSPLLGRALLVHTAIHPDGKPDHLLGHGCILPNVDEIWLCEDHTVTVVFQGAILPTQMVRLPLPWLSDIDVPGKVQISWTIGALAPVDSLHPDDYTSSCLEETFYPNSNRFQFAPGPDQKGKSTRLHLVNDSVEIAKLKSRGWKQSAYPISESGNEYRDEAERRAIDCKWESIVRRTKSKMARSLDAPFMTLHAIGRNGANSRFDYVVVVTICASQFPGDLYAQVRQRFPALAPIRLRTEAETRIPIQ